MALRVPNIGGTATSDFHPTGSEIDIWNLLYGEQGQTAGFTKKEFEAALKKVSRRIEYLADKLHEAFGERGERMMQYGWICPKCGAVWGPMVSACQYCGPKTQVLDNSSSGPKPLIPYEQEVNWIKRHPYVVPPTTA